MVRCVIVRRDGPANTPCATGLALTKWLARSGASTFAIVFSPTAANDVKARIACFEEGKCHMVAGLASQVAEAVVRVSTWRGGQNTCPTCGWKGLTEDGLVEHHAMQHITMRSHSDRCPLCNDRPVHDIGKHLHARHGPVARGEAHADGRPDVRFASFVMGVVRRCQAPPAASDHGGAAGGEDVGSGSGSGAGSGGHEEGGGVATSTRYLLEQRGTQYYLPLRPISSHFNPIGIGAEVLTSALGSTVELDGVLQVQYWSEDGGDAVKMVSVLLGHPASLDDSHAVPAIPSWDAAGCAWASAAECRDLDKAGKLGHPAVMKWVQYLEEGGAAQPLTLLGDDPSRFPDGDPRREVQGYHPSPRW